MRSRLLGLIILVFVVSFIPAAAWAGLHLIWQWREVPLMRAAGFLLLSVSIFGSLMVIAQAYRPPHAIYPIEYTGLVLSGFFILSVGVNYFAFKVLSRK